MKKLTNCLSSSNKAIQLKLLLLTVLVLLLVLFNYSTIFAPDEPHYGKVQRQTVAREFRAAWVASVANINWPSQPGLSTKAQQAEAIKILDDIVESNMNAVILQVRPQADALYQSELEPWSYYLTGEQGRAPQPFYDPLSFWVEQAHQRGLELHAWLNPYRAHHIEGGEVSAASLVSTHSDFVVKLQSGYYWMDPGKKETAEHSLAVVEDIVRRYDIDGIHYDDYFYPYPSYHDGKPFPDDKTYQAYLNDNGKLSQNDWRRESVNRFVRTLYQSVKAIKKHVKVGVSPFGIWRPGHPETILGMDQYDKLYADAKLWLNEGWLDYFTPQLYWAVNRIPQSFPVLLNWWRQENTQGRHLWPGIASNKAHQWQGRDEVVNQIMISRGMLGQQTGIVFWNVDSIEDNPVFKQTLTDSVFYNPALVPASPWLSDELPQAPKVSHSLLSDQVEIKWQAQGHVPVVKWLVYYRYHDRWHYQLLGKNSNQLTLPLAQQQRGARHEIKAFAVIGVDRLGMESERVNICVSTECASSMQ